MDAGEEGKEHRKGKSWGKGKAQRKGLGEEGEGDANR